MTVLNDPASWSDQIQNLLNELENETIDLPVERKERAEAAIHNIRTLLSANLPGRAGRPDLTQTRGVEEVLAASELRYRELAESITDPFIVYDANLRLTYRNRAAADTSQVADEQVLGRTFSEIYPQLVGSEIHQVYSRVLETHQPERYVNKWVRPSDGQEFYFDLSAYPTSSGLIAFSKDVTDQIKAEQAQREALDQAVWMSRFPNENPNPVSRVSRDGQILYCNRASAEPSAWAFKKGECIPEPFFSLLAEVNRQGAPVERDVQVGERFYSITLMPFAHDQYLNLYGLDITERKRIEARLRESEARERSRANELEALMDAAPAVIWISRDPECREMTGNRYSYDFLHIQRGANVSKTAPEEELVVQQYHMEKDNHPIPVSELPMQIAAATGKPAQDYSFDLIYEDGTVFHMFGNVNPLFDRDGIPYGAIGVFVDLTAVRRLQTEQVMAKAEIEVQRRLMDQREKDRYTIARDLHDGPIQTLSSSMFHLQLIKEAFPDAALQLELSQIGMDIKNTINELRDALNELRPPALMHFGFSKVIRMHTEDFRTQFPNIEISLDIVDDDKLLSAQAHLTLFRIFQAGINNIVRHSGASKIWVVYKIEQDSFYLELRDNGRGFELIGDLAQLTRDGHFGLVGMKERAQAIGGEFSISSEPGNGTTIIVKGPLSGINLKT